MIFSACQLKIRLKGTAKHFLKASRVLAQNITCHDAQSLRFYGERHGTNKGSGSKIGLKKENLVSITGDKIRSMVKCCAGE